mmetsp:Transcript_43296/g.41684  ORF Transcript_43296/g.41684 Transcript_43296/m.41684 type:complete len:81 (-) Transcript_43296:723-965(-)
MEVHQPAIEPNRNSLFSLLTSRTGINEQVLGGDKSLENGRNVFNFKFDKYKDKIEDILEINATEKENEGEEKTVSSKAFS